MDKQEYKILSEEIMTLVANEQFLEAADIADRIDWRKVRSFTMLQRISDLYKINRRFEEALEIILMAYDKNPNSKTIVYSICELYLEMGDLITALQYMGVYNKMAPKDVGGAILKYKVLELEEAPYEDRIDQLEKIVSMSYQAEWAYQLAYMYHRMGLGRKCVECCNQLISWFGSGAFVIKAMELKMLHEKLSPSQQEIYNQRNNVEEELQTYEGEEDVPGSSDMGEEDFHVKTIDMSKFNTVNLQKALAESMRELMGDDTVEFGDTGTVGSNITNTDKVTRAIIAPMMDTASVPDNIPDETAYVDLDEALSKRGIKKEEVSEEEPVYEEPANDEEAYEESVDNETSSEEPTYEEPEMVIDENASLGDYTGKLENPSEEETFFEDKTGDIVIDEVPLGMLNDLIPGVEFVPTRSVKKAAKEAEASTIKSNATKKSDYSFDSILSYGNDGQISMVVPEKSSLEKQITGQMNLQDVLAEWEKVKRKKEAQQNALVRKNILEKTGKIFEDYDESIKNGILAQIDEEQKKHNKILKDSVTTRNIDDIAKEHEQELIEKPAFDATAALNKTYGPNIWDEVNQSIAEDAKAATSGVVAGAVAGTVAAGALVAELESDALPVEDLVAGAAVSGILNSIEKPDSEGVYSEELQESYEDDASYSEDNYADEVSEEYPEENYEDYSEEENYEEYPEEVSDEAYEDYPEEEYVSEEYEDNYEYANEEGQVTSSLNTEQLGIIGTAIDEAANAVVEEYDENYEDVADERDFSVDEQQIFEDFLYSRKMRAQILDAVDVISMASYVGNVIISGDSGSGTIHLAKAIIKEIQLIDSNFISSKVAKISGSKMNQKDIPGMFMQLANGALIIEKAGKLTKETLENITRALENATDGIIVILTDTKKEIEKIIRGYDVITGYFNARIDITPMSNNALVDYAKKYAYSKEYKIDEERAVLTLHERISELQIGEHHVTSKEVEAIVDRAIAHSRRPRVSTFVDILVAKRYDNEDMIILKEKDFED